MVEWSLERAAEAMDARVLAGDTGRAIHGTFRTAAIDSRQIRGDEIFFALPGERVDGHDFAAAAASKGAAAVVVHRDAEPSGSAVWLRVDDTFEALHALTRAVRREVPQNLVAITGSSGKTTTKELLATLLATSYKTARNPGNLNNLYGFPMALLAVPNDTEWMVAEMGMSFPGELGGVSRLGRPDVALFTNVRAVHLENFDDVRGIAEAKAELLEGLPDDGLVIANADDPEVLRIARRWHAAHPDGRVVLYGLHAENVDARAVGLEPLGGGRVGTRFKLRVRGESGEESIEIELPLHGLYNVENALAAAACAHRLSIPLDAIRDALAGFAAVAGRGEIHRPSAGAVAELVVVDDSYNSNPDAAQKALESAREIAGHRHVAVLGDMLELGPREAEFHRQVGVRAAELGYGLVVGVGERARELVATAAQGGAVVAHFENAATAAVGLPSALRPGDAVLVKGSRGVGLDVVVRAILAAPDREEAA